MTGSSRVLPATVVVAAATGTGVAAFAMMNPLSANGRFVV